MTERYNLLIEGMTCSACSTRLERVLANANGVAAAAVNLPLERATVDAEPSLSLRGIVDMVRRAGFDAATEERIFGVNKVNTPEDARAVEAALSEHPGVVSAQVDENLDEARVKLFSLVVSDEQLSERVKAAGYGLKAAGEAADPAVEREHRRAVRDRWAIAISLCLTAPFFYQMMLNHLTPGATMAMGEGWHLHPLMEAALATPLQFIIGARFYRGAYNALRGGGANMDVLVAMGTSAAYIYSWYQVFALGPNAMGQLYFEASAMIITLVLIGKYMEAHAKRGAAQAIRELLALRPTTALVRLPDGTIVERPIQEVKVGDVLVCRPGQQVAADGVVVSGEAEIDEALITGESAPVPKQPGDSVTTGSINIDGLIDIKTLAIGGDSTLSKMIRLIENAQASKPAVQRLVDRVSSIFVPTVVAISAVALIGWLLAGASWETAIINAVAVLVIACPCALGLATPTAIMTGSGAAARAGILIKDVASLEQAHNLTHVVFDKTGTLTEGEPALGRIDLLAGLDEDESLRLMASLQQGSEHPIALAIRNAAEARNLELHPIENFKSKVAQGVQAEINGVLYLAGNARLFTGRGLDPPPRELHLGGTEVWLGASTEGGEAILAWFEIVDGLRPQAGEAVSRLKDLGVTPLLVSGDAVDVTKRIAGEVGITEIRGEARPEDKANIIADLMKDGARVGMAGDGINDAPALAQATVGIAMGSGTDVAMETAAITLMRSDPRLVAAAIEVSRKTFRKIKQNLFWAFIYNVIGLPLAALGYLSPPLAAAAMAFSSVSVVGNSLMLRIWNPKTTGERK